MVTVLTIDDGETARAGKTRMYGIFAAAKGASVTNKKLQNLDNPSQLLGFDIILTDLDGKSAKDTSKFFGLLESACKLATPPVVRMYSGYFKGQSDDLPVAIPDSLVSVVTTCEVTKASSSISECINLVSTEQTGPRTSRTP